MRLVAEGLSATRGEDLIFQDISFEIAGGEALVVKGPNGSGKSTLLNCIMNLLEPQQGSILLEGTSVRDWGQRGIAQRIAYVPQSVSVQFSYTVRDYAAMGRAPPGLREAPRAEAVAWRKSRMASGTVMVM